VHSLSVRDYYEATLLDYRILWMNRTNRAMHFGYWGDRARSHPESLEAMDRLLAKRLGVTTEDHVLDAGCGVGGSALWLARTRGASVTGITTLPVQVRRARRYARQQRTPLPNSPTPRFYLADYCRTPFAAASFDVIWALESVCHALDKAAFFLESRRLLRPGGRLGVAEYVLVDPAQGEGQHAELSTWLTGWSIPGLATAAELTQMASEAGFADVHFEDLTPAIARSSRRMYQIAVFLWPLEWWLHFIRLRNRRQHTHVLATLAQYRALQQGLWRYVVITAMAR
jgi:tocopherol O-methyltransferase